MLNTCADSIENNTNLFHFLQVLRLRIYKWRLIVRNIIEERNVRENRKKTYLQD